MITEQLRREHPDEADAYESIWKRIWFIVSSICITTLWVQRNRVTFQHEVVTINGSVAEFWETSMRQLRAIGKRESRRAAFQIQGTRLIDANASWHDYPKSRHRQ